MDMLPSAFQLELAEATADFCQQQDPVAIIRTRRGDDSPIEAKTWRAGAELGFIGLSASESLGGQGQGISDHALVCRELGRALLPGPWVATMIATQVAAAAGHNDLARAFIAGDDRAGFVLSRGNEVVDERVRGELTLVDAADAGWMLLCDESGVGLIRTSELACLKPVSCIDPGSRLHSAVADNIEVHCWSSQAAQTLHAANCLAAAQLVGIAEAAMARAVEYASTRIQFGKPIGVNQAIKHRCADMAVATEAALQQTLFASVSVDERRNDVEFHCRAAKFLAGRAAIDNAGAGIQIHGGMGFTYEHDMHLFLSKAHVLDLVMGRGREQLPRILALPAVD
jgi:alkylation response protein AidB-like acyl-CoA dehydrogenase